MDEQVPLATKTTLGIGGVAHSLRRCTTPAALRDALAAAADRAQPVFVLGGGSNLVVHDAGWPGLVLVPALAGWTAQEQGARVQVTVGAGVPWDEFVEQMARRGWAGIECLAGIPGQVGATPIQNVGAYGQEIAETLVALEALDRTTGEHHTLTHADCAFGYRQSRFNTTELGRWIVCSVTFQLRSGGAPTLTYRDLIQHFGEGASPSLTELTAAVRRIRASKGMVIDLADPDCRSAGSFFKNPVLAMVPDGAPAYPQPDGTVKTSAAWLIERAGFRRGQALVGGVGISSKHVLALVNQGSATAEALAAAACLIQRGVQEHWGITLHPEPCFVGPWVPDTLPEGATVFRPE